MAEKGKATPRKATKRRAAARPGAAPRYRRVVAKLGTGLLTAGSDQLDQKMMSSLVAQVAALRRDGVDVAVVSSGAIAAGRHRLAQREERRNVPHRQVLASVGQSQLMHRYDRLFGQHGLVCGQALVTRRDLSDRLAYLNARNTLLALLELGAIPIVNENDVVAVEEIEGTSIGDNDNLSALVANLIDADLLAILTDTGGLHTEDPRRNPDAELVPLVEKITPAIEALADDAATPHGVGGMITKLQAAKLATAGGADVVVADGHEPNVLTRLVSGESIGTRFPASGTRLESRKRWMLTGLKARGRIVVDEGAARAILAQGRSLLAAGVREAHGPFERGDTVPIYDHEGHRIAMGITNYGHEDAARLCGVRSDRIVDVLGYEYGSELVHRNNLVKL